ncbi:alpha/beta hydrolase [Cupriavidus numazuensis]|uniref:Acetyl esterase n=1 Tax=Cupriavidus numazuensis TaxID=221992 RepID=A0ABM8TLM1_9BURK|nr:alpha/beta hydrolase [Cupriavidus numazuensis]CAG2153834.1 Acetyl esterase [Cupriavidus numazuensis]
MALDPQARAILDLIAASGNPPVHQRDLQDARATFNLKPLAGPAPDVARVEDRFIPVADGSIPVRIYTPVGGDGRQRLPVLVYFHGGGWVLGDLDAVDIPCRHLSNRADCIVASVQYRKAPEQKFPTAAEDAFAAVRWVHDHADELHADPARIAVGGDSAGGNLAAVSALMHRDRGGVALCCQLLIYPVTDHDFGTSSYRENAEGYLLARDDMRWFWRQYLPEGNDGHDPYASPLRAHSLSGLPPALVITAGFDPLRDEGAAYAERLDASGVRVRHVRYDSMIHGFFWMPGALAQARDAYEACADTLREAFAMR